MGKKNNVEILNSIINNETLFLNGQVDKTYSEPVETRKSKEIPKRDEKGRIMKGYSGNPNGRGSGSMSITSAIIRKLKECGTMKDGTKRQYLDLMVERIVGLAIIDGDVQMLKEVWHAIDGVPTIKALLTGNANINNQVVDTINSIKDDRTRQDFITAIERISEDGQIPVEGSGMASEEPSV